MISKEEFYLKVVELFEIKTDSMPDGDFIDRLNELLIQTNPEKEDIYSIVDWWQNLPMHFNDIDTLIEKRRKLSGMYVFLAKYYSDKQKHYCHAYPSRKVKQAKQLITSQETLDDKTDKYTTLGKSESIALVEVESEYMNDYALKGELEGLKEIKGAIKVTLSAMSQEIADLREIRSKEHTATQ